MRIRTLGLATMAYGSLARESIEFAIAVRSKGGFKIRNSFFYGITFVILP